MSWFNDVQEWFLSLGKNYGVNPYIFGTIYVGAIPLFFLCLAWTIKRMRAKKNFTIPLLLTGLCFVSAYLYLIIAGKNIPIWVYVFVAAMILYGIYSTYTKIKERTRAE